MRCEKDRFDKFDRFDRFDGFDGFESGSGENEYNNFGLSVGKNYDMILFGLC